MPLFAKTDKKNLLSESNGKLRYNGGINRKDWRTVSPSDVIADPDRTLMELVPMLRAGHAPPRNEIAAWTGKLVAECRERLSLVLPLDDAEKEFLRRLNDEGEIVPDLITGDSAMQAKLREHPGHVWKAMNVRTHRGPGGAAAQDENRRTEGGER